MNNPLPGDFSAIRLNRTLHGRSVYRKRDVPGHNCIVGYNTPGKGDGLDLFLPAGTPVYSMHEGKVTRLFGKGGLLEGIYLWNGKTGADSVLTVYAHLNLKSHIAVGSHVYAAQTIGYIGRKLKDPHLHLEAWIGGKSLAGNTAHRLRDKIRGLLL